MDKTVKFFKVFLFATMLVYNVACTKEEEYEEPNVTQYGTVKGAVNSIEGGRQGFKVSLTEHNSQHPLQVIVTEEDGCFNFSEVPVGSYKIDVQKEGFVCISKTVNDVEVRNEYEIQIEAKQVLYINVLMLPNSSYINGELKITDLNGNPIGNWITIQKYTPIIALRLYNETSQYISWYFFLWQSCYLQGARDTIIGNYSGFTGYGSYQIFSNISPSSGRISPGENVLVTLTINQNIYDLDYFSYEYSTLSLSANSSTHSYSKDIELDLPFVNITDMDEWTDDK